MNAAQQHIAYLGLGSNLGDRLANLRAAIDGLGQTPGLMHSGDRPVASVYESEAAGMAAGTPAFLNTAVRVQTTLSPSELLDAVLEVEAFLGRVRANEIGQPREMPRSRAIDIDVLLYDDLVLAEPGLIVPHPRLHERLFVLEPLAEIAGGVIHPTSGKSISELAAQARQSPGASAITPWEVRLYACRG